MNGILGVVLAGGRSSRFGSDKATALWRGRSLIEHALAALAPHCDALAVSGREWSGLPSLPDRPAPDMGPLGGLNAALHHAQAGGYRGLLVTGCDMPVFPAALAEALIGDGAAVLAQSHLAGWWPSSLAPLLDDFVTCDPKRSMRRWMELAQARPVNLPDLMLPNVNTPADLTAMLSLEDTP